jgi:hypothetical protein
MKDFFWLALALVVLSGFAFAEVYREERCADRGWHWVNGSACALGRCERPSK